MEIILLGIVIDVRVEKLEKALFLIDLIFSGIIKFVISSPFKYNFFA